MRTFLAVTLCEKEYSARDNRFYSAYKPVFIFLAQHFRSVIAAAARNEGLLMPIPEKSFISSSSNIPLCKNTRNAINTPSSLCFPLSNAQTVRAYNNKLRNLKAGRVGLLPGANVFQHQKVCRHSFIAFFLFSLLCESINVSLEFKLSRNLYSLNMNQSKNFSL